MKTKKTLARKRVIAPLLLTSSLVMGGLAMAQDVKIVKPGGIGQAPQEISADKAVEIVANSYTPDDVMFMKDMIPHHMQAVEMANLVDGRTNNQSIEGVAGRIKASQDDEIKFMIGWLSERGEGGMGDHAGHTMMTSMKMAGMASPEQMKQLADSSGTDFDKLFLELMIAHHKGAIAMVRDLHDKSGSAYDPVLYDFTNEVVNDQNAEITRMSVLLAELSGDPRSGLSAGLHDAGMAQENMKLLAALPKPAGFFDPSNPSGKPPLKDELDEDGKPKRGTRSPLLNFSNTDIAFAGDKVVVGSYHGFNVYQLDQRGMPELYSSVVCPGGQGDVSVVGDLLIMSVEQTRGRVDCGLEGISEDVSEDRFRGIRIFDISDYQNPVQVGQVQTCRGSHTHSIVSGPDADGKIIVYNSGTSSVRDEEEMAGCIGNVPGDDRTALFRIDVIEIPVDNPAASRIVDSPAVFADPETGNLAGLWLGGDHGENTQRTRQTNQCHDITVFPDANLAAGACSGNGIIFDISDPRKPTRIDEVIDPGFAYWHSATFNNDGTKVLFTDEWGGGGRPRCLAGDPKTWGANAIYDIVDNELEYRSTYKLPAAQSEQENCVAHNGAVVPVPGRDIFVQAWYQGGISILDFTDSRKPTEIAYFDRGPVDADMLVMGGYWSTYWYQGKIYGSEIARGLDVFELLPSNYLTANEIAAAAVADQGPMFNPQQQYKVQWPAVPVVARAYIDQLNRSEALSAEQNAALASALDNAEARLNANGSDAALATQLASLAGTVQNGGGDDMTQTRRTRLADTLNGIAAKLR